MVRKFLCEDENGNEFLYIVSPELYAELKEACESQEGKKLTEGSVIITNGEMMASADIVNTSKK